MVVGSTSSALCVNFFTRTELGGPSHGTVPGGGGEGAGAYSSCSGVQRSQGLWRPEWWWDPLRQYFV